MQEKICANCGNRFEDGFLESHGKIVDGVWYCWNCAKKIENQKAKEKEQQRERERERDRKEYERDRNRNEERNYRKEQRNRELYREEQERERQRRASLKTYTCCHCGQNFNEEEGKSALDSEIGKPVCDECYDKYLVRCYGCQKFFWKNKDDVKPCGIPIYEVNDGGRIEKYSEIYGCADCISHALYKDQAYFDEQKILAKKYEQQQEEDAAAERRQQQEEERQEEERKKRELENAVQEKAKAEQERLTLARKETDIMDKSLGLLFGFILLIASFIYGFANNWGMGVTAGVGVFFLVVSYLLRVVTAKLSAGLIIGAVFELAFGLVISVVCWIMWDAFLVPLGICYAIFFVLGSILYTTGALKKVGKNDL